MVDGLVLHGVDCTKSRPLRPWLGAATGDVLVHTTNRQVKTSTFCAIQKLLNWNWSCSRKKLLDNCEITEISICWWTKINILYMLSLVIFSCRLSPRIPVHDTLFELWLHMQKLRACWRLEWILVQIIWRASISVHKSVALWRRQGKSNGPF